MKPARRLLLLLILLLTTPALADAAVAPVAVHLPYVMLQPGAAARAQLELGLSDSERDALATIARAQDATVRALDPTLPGDIYNAQVLAAAAEAHDRVEGALGPDKSAA
ncbi:MAG TPA: hypothetical protein VFK80_07135, partial [Limnochordia bacterium]|nr:hypothetical protein [Limnochordia bacterium]